MTAATKSTKCEGTTRPDDLSICDMYLRAMPDDVAPCRPPRRVDTPTWLYTCYCDRPEINLCFSPLGVAVEIAFGSADHRVCSAVHDNQQYIDSCSPEIAAEALSRLEQYDEFERLILSSPRAREHILSLPAESLHSRFSEQQPTPAHIEYTKHIARTAIARGEAQRALIEIAGGKA